MSGDGFVADDGFEADAPPRPKSGRESVIGEEAPGFWRGVARGGYAIPGLLGLDYETAQAAEWAVRDPENLEKTRGLGFKDRYRWYKDREVERSRRGEEENPIRTGLGVGAGAAPSTLLLPSHKVAQGAGLAARAGSSALTAGTQAAAIEGGVSAELPPAERLKRMGTAAVSAAALGTLAPMPSHTPSQAQIDTAAGVPAGGNASSARLIDEGVPLTPGQRAPGSKWAQIEEASTSLPIVGPAINDARATARDAWTSKAFEKGAAPGAPAPSGASPGELVASLRSGFDDAYGAIKGSMAPESVGGLPSAFDAAASRADVLATDAQRGQVAAFLKNQLSLIDREAPTVEKLLAIRSNIRAAKRTADPAAIPLLRSAEESVTKTLTDGTPAGVADHLAAIDRQYANYKTLGRASRKAGDQPAGMSPTHLSNAVRENTPSVVYEQGGGGPLREWAAAGKEVFDTRVPMTGARLLTLAPGVRYPLGALAAFRASRSATTVAKLQQALKSNPQAFGEHAPKLLAAAERGPEALAAAHYVLSLDPGSGYRARAAQVLDTPNEQFATETTP